jgi:hypothetical protein
MEIPNESETGQETFAAENLTFNQLRAAAELAKTTYLELDDRFVTPDGHEVTIVPFGDDLFTIQNLGSMGNFSTDTLAIVHKFSTIEAAMATLRKTIIKYGGRIVKR